MLQDGETALTLASSSGNVPIVRALLEKSAKTDLHKEVRNVYVVCITSGPNTLIEGQCFVDETFYMPLIHCSEWEYCTDGGK